MAGAEVGVGDEVAAVIEAVGAVVEAMTEDDVWVESEVGVVVGGSALKRGEAAIEVDVVVAAVVDELLVEVVIEAEYVVVDEMDLAEEVYLIV